MAKVAASARRSRVRKMPAPIGTENHLCASIVIESAVSIPSSAGRARMSALARCYNVADVTLGARAVVSQFTHMCTASHDYRDPAFPLFAKPIWVGSRAWVCAGSFVGPGVSVGDGAILSAHSVTHQDLEPWTIYRGNPAVETAKRPMIHD